MSAETTIRYVVQLSHKPRRVPQPAERTTSNSHVKRQHFYSSGAQIRTRFSIQKQPTTWAIFPLRLCKQLAVRTVCWAMIAKIDFVHWSGTWKNCRWWVSQIQIRELFFTIPWTWHFTTLIESLWFRWFVLLHRLKVSACKSSGTTREDCASIAAISLSLARSLVAHCLGRQSGQK